MGREGLLRHFAVFHAVYHHQQISSPVRDFVKPEGGCLFGAEHQGAIGHRGAWLCRGYTCGREKIGRIHLEEEKIQGHTLDLSMYLPYIP